MKSGNPKRSRSVLIFSSLGLLVVVVAIIAILGGSSVPSNIPTTSVQHGEFIISLTETGELRATNSVVVTSPTVRTNLQIIFLAEKGSVIAQGDTLIVFDGTELQQTINEKEADLEIALSNLEKNEASVASNMASLHAQLRTSQAGYRQAELRLQQMQFEADIVREEQELALEQAEINLEQAQERIEQQRIIDQAETVTLELRVQQARSELERARRDLGKLTILAPQPGLVVYKQIWKGGDYSEVRVGDTPWRGQALIELPDLSQMEVTTSVNEVDVSNVEVGLEANVVLDAFPEQVFTGEVTEISTLARIDEDNAAEIKVFDVTIRVNETDPVLRPGMTVATTIFIERIPDVMWIPLDAVFRKEGRNVAFRRSGGSFRETELELGRRNDNHIVIINGLSAEDQVCLIDPTQPYDEGVWQGYQEQALEESGGSAISSIGSNGSQD